MRMCGCFGMVVMGLVMLGGLAVAGEQAGPWGMQPEMHPATERQSARALPWRSWQLQNDNEQVGDLIAAAERFGVNNIQLSHNLVMFAHRLLQDEGKIERFNRYIELAHERGMTVQVWTHEFAGIPREITKEKKWFDGQAVWELLDDRYAQLFRVMPRLDGIVLTFHETDIKVFDVESDMPLAERVAKLINHLYRTCQRLDKTLVVRTFAYEPGQVEGIAEAFAMIDPKIMLMSKCVPHDWEVFYPHNLAIGQYADRQHIIEYDPGAEFYGQGHVPYLYPEYLHFRMQYARARNAYGYVARVERMGENPPAVRGISEGSGWNELNLYAMKRYAEDPAVGAEQIWREYLAGRVGEGAYLAPLTEAMKLTDDVLNRCYFMLGCWYNNHSRLPSASYADGHIQYIRKWHPVYEAVCARLARPDGRTVGEVFLESKEAVALARRALDKLELAARSGLAEGHVKDYRAQLEALLETAEQWAAYRNKYIQKKSGGLEPVYEGDFPVGGPPRIELE